MRERETGGRLGEHGGDHSRGERRRGRAAALRGAEVEQEPRGDSRPVGDGLEDARDGEATGAEGGRRRSCPRRGRDGGGAPGRGGGGRRPGGGQRRGAPLEDGDHDQRLEEAGGGAWRAGEGGRWEQAQGRGSGGAGEVRVCCGRKKKRMRGGREKEKEEKKEKKGREKKREEGGKREKGEVEGRIRETEKRGEGGCKV